MKCAQKLYISNVEQKKKENSLLLQSSLLNTKTIVIKLNKVISLLVTRANVYAVLGTGRLIFC